MSIIGSLVSGILHGIAGSTTSGFSAAVQSTDDKTQGVANAALKGMPTCDPSGPFPKGDPTVANFGFGFSHPIHIEVAIPSIYDPNRPMFA